MCRSPLSWLPHLSGALLSGVQHKPAFPRGFLSPGPRCLAARLSHQTELESRAVVPSTADPARLCWRECASFSTWKSEISEASGARPAPEGPRGWKCTSLAAPFPWGSPSSPAYPFTLQSLSSSRRVCFPATETPGERREGTDWLLPREGESLILGPALLTVCPPGLKAQPLRVTVCFLQEKLKPLRLPRTQAGSQ